MAKTKFIEVPIGKSVLLAAILVAIHAAAVLSVSVLPLPMWLRASAIALLLLNLILLVTRYALVALPTACSIVRINEDASVALTLKNGTITSGKLRDGWLVSPLMIAARVRCDGVRIDRKIVLLPDSAEAETLRRLRIFLRFAISESTGQK